MASQALARRMAGTLRRGGARGLALTLLGRTVLRQVILIERDLTQPVVPLSSSIDFRFALLGHEDLDAYCAYRPERRREEVEARLARGSVCYVAWIDGGIVSDSWYQHGEAWIEDLGRRFELRPDEAYSYDAHTAERLRGKSLTPARASLALAHLREGGFRRAVAFVLPENGPARRSPVKSGWSRFGVAGCLRLGAAQLQYVTTDAGGRRWRLRRRCSGDAIPPLESAGQLDRADVSDG
jgi:hypothetical protein